MNTTPEKPNMLPKKVVTHMQRLVQEDFDREIENAGSDRKLMAADDVRLTGQLPAALQPKNDGEPKAMHMYVKDIA